jgi:hypothetical protein
VKKTTLLFLVILIEGYVVLASELLVMRQLIPFVGSGTEIIAIIISGVLLPLAIGYEAGGKAFPRIYKRKQEKQQKTPSIRSILLTNILTSVIILGLGLSYVILEVFFSILGGIGITNRLLQTTLYVSIFLVVPVYLLGQTVPLVSNYFSRERLSEITGKMLFFSTTGSFLGSVFSTIVLMSVIGVHNTVVVTLGLLCMLCFLLSHKKIAAEALLCIPILGMIYVMNSDSTMRALHIVSNNAYNTASIYDVRGEHSTILSLNRSASSKFSKQPEDKFEYIRFIEDHFITPLKNSGDTPYAILIVGAGGFTLGLDDNKNQYTFVDIDPALKDISEKYFLKQKLGPNKKFVAASARAFVNKPDQLYDLIVLDTYTNTFSIPMETTTREYLESIKKLLKPDGVLIANIISKTDFSDVFTVRYDNTFTSVFPNHSRQVVSKPTSTRGREGNIIYTYFHNSFVNDRTIYTDDKNTYSIDRK